MSENFNVSRIKRNEKKKKEKKVVPQMNFYYFAKKEKRKCTVLLPFNTSMNKIAKSKVKKT